MGIQQMFLGAGAGGKIYTEATGGVVSEYDESGTKYRAHVYVTSGTFNVTTAGEDGVEYLVIAGGGGGGCDGCGRGGGG